MRGESYSVVHENLPGFPFVDLTQQDDLEGREKAALVLFMHINLANLRMKVDFEKGENNR